MAIGLFLLRDHCNIGIAHFFQRAGHGLQSGTVQRAIHNGNISVDLFAEQHRLALHFLHEGRINIIRNIPDRSACNIRFKGTVLNIRKDVQLFDLCQDLRCGLGRDLATVSAVDLVAVILAGVVGGRDHNARRRFQVSYREGNRGNRHQRGPDVHLHSVCRKYTGSDPGKQVALDAAVIANGHGRVRKMGFQVIGQALGRFCHRIDIDAVSTCTDHATQTACAKSQVPVKGIPFF